MTDLLERLLPKMGEIIEGRYRVDSKLGEGGFGVVYRAIQTNINRQVAIKMLLPHALADKMAVHRFHREVDLARRLEHPNTVRMFDQGETSSGLHYYVMEYVKGPTLGELLQDEGPLDPVRVRKITEQSLMALGEAHGLNIVHRDLKPANIMLTNIFGQKDFVKVLDFGIGKAFGGTAAFTGPETQGLIGTPFYMSPEQATASDDLDGRSDIYALGLIMHELLTGVKAVTGPSAMQIVMFHVQKDPVPLHEAVLNGPLGGVIERAVQKNRDQRYPNALAMLEALQAVGIAMTPYPNPLGAGAGAGAGAGPNAGVGLPPHTPWGIQKPPAPVGNQPGAGGDIHGDKTWQQTQSSQTSGSKKGVIIAALVLLIAGGAGVFLAIQDPSAAGGNGPGQGSGAQTELDAGSHVAVGETSQPETRQQETRQPDTGQQETRQQETEADLGQERETQIATVDVGSPGDGLESAHQAALAEGLALASASRWDESIAALTPIPSESAHHAAAQDLLTMVRAEQASDRRRSWMQNAVVTVRPLLYDARHRGDQICRVANAPPECQVGEDAGVLPTDGTEGSEEVPVDPGTPVASVVHVEGSPSSVRIRFRDTDAYGSDYVCRRLPCDITLPEGEGTVELRVSGTDCTRRYYEVERIPEQTLQVRLSCESNPNNGNSSNPNCPPGAIRPECL